MTELDKKIKQCRRDIKQSWGHVVIMFVVFTGSSLIGHRSTMDDFAAIIVFSLVPLPTIVLKHFILNRLKRKKLIEDLIESYQNKK